MKCERSFDSFQSNQEQFSQEGDRAKTGI